MLEANPKVSKSVIDNTRQPKWPRSSSTSPSAHLPTARQFTCSVLGTIITDNYLSPRTPPRLVDGKERSAFRARHSSKANDTGTITSSTAITFRMTQPENSPRNRPLAANSTFSTFPAAGHRLAVVHTTRLQSVIRVTAPSTWPKDARFRPRKSNHRVRSSLVKYAKSSTERTSQQLSKRSRHASPGQLLPRATRTITTTATSTQTCLRSRPAAAAAATRVPRAACPVPALAVHAKDTASHVQGIESNSTAAAHAVATRTRVRNVRHRTTRDIAPAPRADRASLCVGRQRSPMWCGQNLLLRLHLVASTTSRLTSSTLTIRCVSCCYCFFSSLSLPHVFVRPFPRFLQALTSQTPHQLRREETGRGETKLDPHFNMRGSP